MSFATTMYCDKCGKTWVIFPPYTDESTICNICKNTLKPVPDEYFENLSNEGFLLSKDMQQKLINNLVLISPNFDQYYFEHKDEIKNHQDKELSVKIENGRRVLNEQVNIPKCPTCQSTNVQKIGTGERVASVAMLGVFSKKINKSFKCKSCGYTW